MINQRYHSQYINLPKLSHQGWKWKHYFMSERTFFFLIWSRKSFSSISLQCYFYFLPLFLPVDQHSCFHTFAVSFTRWTHTQCIRRERRGAAGPLRWTSARRAVRFTFKKFIRDMTQYKSWVHLRQAMLSFSSFIKLAVLGGFGHRCKLGLDSRELLGKNVTLGQEQENMLLNSNV